MTIKYKIQYKCLRCGCLYAGQGMDAEAEMPPNAARNFLMMILERTFLPFLKKANELQTPEKELTAEIIELGNTPSRIIHECDDGEQGVCYLAGLAPETLIKSVAAIRVPKLVPTKKH